MVKKILRNNIVIWLTLSLPFLIANVIVHTVYLRFIVPSIFIGVLIYFVKRENFSKFIALLIYMILILFLLTDVILILFQQKSFDLRFFDLLTFDSLKVGIEQFPLYALAVFSLLVFLLLIAKFLFTQISFQNDIKLKGNTWIFNFFIGSRLV